MNAKLTLASELNKPMAPLLLRGQIPWMWNTRQVDDVTDGRLPNEDWFGKIAAGLRAGRRKQRSDAEARNYVLTIRAEWIRAPIDLDDFMRRLIESALDGLEGHEAVPDQVAPARLELAQRLQSLRGCRIGRPCGSPRPGKE